VPPRHPYVRKRASRATRAQAAFAEDAPPPAAGAAPAAAPLPDYTAPGPLQPMRGPRLEHTRARCFPVCQTNACLLRVEVWYPKGGSALGLSPPYPLAIFTSGFLVDKDAYRSYATMLASWGHTAVLYDKAESALSSINDEVSAKFVSVRPAIRSLLCLPSSGGVHCPSAAARAVHGCNAQRLWQHA
jgi:hypothetical protein